MGKDEVRTLRTVTEARSIQDLQRGRVNGVLAWMVVDTALSTGLRVSEIVALKVEDLDLKMGAVKVVRLKKKKKVQETVPVGKEFIRHAKDYLQWRGDRLGEMDKEYRKGLTDKAGVLLVGQRGPLTNRGAQQIWKTAIKRAGLRPDLSIHSARHTLATTLLRKTKNLRQVQKMLGHSSPTVTANMYADEPVWLKTRGDIKLQTSGPRDALPDFEAAARIAQYQAHYTVAVLQAMAQLGQLQQGLDYYQNTIPAIERHPRVTVRYAELLARAGQVNDAVDQFLQASHAAGYTDVLLLQELAATLMDVFGGERALELFRAAPRQPQWQRDARHLESILLTRLKRTSEALAVNASLLDTTENDAERAMLLAARGNLLEGLEQWDDARDVYEKLLKVDERNVIGLNNLAYLLTDKLHRPADAVPYARRAAQLSANPTVLDTLAWTHVELGNYRDAIAILTQILDANPTFVIGLYHLAEVYRRNGDFAKADSVLAGAENLIAEGIGREMAEKIKECRDNITAKNSKPL